MRFDEYYGKLTPEQRQQLADQFDTSVDYLYQLATGRRKAGPKFLLGIERATKGLVSPHGMRWDEAV